MMLRAQDSAPKVAGEGETQMVFINTAPCDVEVSLPSSTVLNLGRQEVIQQHLCDLVKFHKFHG